MRTSFESSAQSQHFLMEAKIILSQLIGNLCHELISNIEGGKQTILEILNLHAFNLAEYCIVHEHKIDFIDELKEIILLILETTVNRYSEFEASQICENKTSDISRPAAALLST